MTTLLLYLVLSLPGYAPAPPMREAQTDSTAWRSDQLFIAIFSLGPAWDSTLQAHEQQGFAEHSRNLSRLRREKRALIGARFGDKGMIILGAKDMDDAARQFSTDPMVIGRQFNLEVTTFTPFYDGCIPK